MTMSVTSIHIQYRPVLQYGTLLMLMLLAGLMTVRAQEHNHQASLEFFEDKARQDAAYEQGLHWNNAEDELDFWKDQRRFEEQLMKVDRPAFIAYLQNKKAAYLEHRESCDSSCEHGDFYYLQASYYTQYKGDPLYGPGTAVVLEYSATDRNPE